jgi:hypothetical protein
MARRLHAALLAMTFFVAAGAQAAEPITVTVSKAKDLNLRIYGFVETDYIRDTTESASYAEEQDNYVVPTRTVAGGGTNNYAGEHGRAMMSIRNSRLGFELNLPKSDSGIQGQGIIELDMMGNDAPNTVPGATTPSSQTERDFFNNAAVRIRHAYMNLTYNDWNAKIGQTWSLLGWQPYYFPGENAILPTPGMLYRRFTQARVMNTHEFMDAFTLESAADIAKPAQMDSQQTEYHAGLRVASTKIKGASVNGAGTSMVGLSAAVSAAIIPIQTPLGNPTGGAVAFDALVPIIPSSDGKDRSNNLVWAGELMSGSGVGGLEYGGLSSGVTALTAAQSGGSILDSGVAGINNGGYVSLIRYRAFNTHLQYSLPAFMPGGKWATSVGYAQTETRNVADFGAHCSAPLLLSPKNQYGYASIHYDPLDWLRFAGEFSQTRTTYVDASNRFAQNNRLQLTAFFVF